jgi:hypothetical protein
MQNTGGIQYLPGGVNSGFNHVVRDVFPTRLLHLKGDNSPQRLVSRPALFCTALQYTLCVAASVCQQVAVSKSKIDIASTMSCMQRS